MPAIGTCTDVDVTVQIIVNPQPNTGIPIAVVLCENDVAANSPLDLFGQLSGNEPGGTWTDDNTTGALTGSDVDLGITAADVISATDTDNILVIESVDDGITSVVNIDDTFTQQANQSVDGIDYSVYSSGDATLLIEIEDVITT